jgi:Ca-activated chloride channel family protein
MSFIWPAMLLLLAAVPLGAFAYLAGERRRRRQVDRLGFRPADPSGGEPRLSFGRVRRRLPAGLMLAGVTVLVMGLARPQGVVSVPRIEGTIVLAFDVSGSMAATDLQPSRMEAAKAAAKSFVERQPPGVLIGVVAFSDSGFSIQVPTPDSSLVLAAINRLAPERGTSLGRGMLSALQVIEASENPAAGFYTNRASAAPTPDPTQVPKGSHTSAAIVLLTEGENNIAPDPVAVAQAAADRGIRIYPIGIGTPEGTILEVEGFKVHSQLDEPTLRAIAATTDGTYEAAADPAQLQSIYDGLAAQLVIRPEAMEITSWFAGAGLALLLVGGLASLLWLGRLP